MSIEPENLPVSPDETLDRFIPVASPSQSVVRGWIRDVFFVVGTAIMIVIFLYQPVKVEGTSMLPELKDQERIFVNKFVYRFEKISRRDIVVFWYPRDPSKSFIKRIIGLPGDTVEIRSGMVYVNGEPLDEPYLVPEFADKRTMNPRYVDPGYYFAMGDDRKYSSDSRVWGLVPEKYIYGKAVFRYWPVSQIGSID
jgi:signal peptidase I